MTFTISWNVDTDGDWATAANWSPVQLPGVTDDVQIDTADRHTVTFSTGAATINSLSVGNDDFLLSGGMLTVTNGLSVAHDLTVSGGVLAIGANSSVSGVFTDTVANSVSITSGSLGFAGGGSAPVDAFALAAGTTLGFSGGFGSDPIFTLTGGGTLGSAGSHVRLNGGTLAITADTTIAGQLDLTGTALDLGVHDLTFTGNVLEATGFTVEGSGTLTFASGSPISDAHLEGIGRMVLQGATTVQTFVYADNGTVIENQGTVTLTGSVPSFDLGNGNFVGPTSSASLVNDAGATMIFAGSQCQVFTLRTPTTFTNDGTVINTANAHSGIFDAVTFVNNGSVQVESGSLTVQSGMTGSGTVEVDTGATFSLDASATTVSNTVAITGGSGVSHLVGGAASDTFNFTGNSGDNTASGLGGNDIIIGGSGHDTAVYSGAFADYSIVRLPDGTLGVADHVSSRDGTDQVSGVEQFNFSDGPKSLAQVAEITNFNVFWHHDGTDDWRDWTVAATAPVGHAIGAPTDWDIKATGDFNGDGTSDALWVNTATGEFRTLTYAPDGSVSSVNLLGALPPGWAPTATGDFNGDGTSDIVLQNASTEDIRLWTMNNGNVTSTSLLAGGSLSPDWRVTGSGDFNADGKYDLILKNITTGEVREWLLNGGTIVQNNVLGYLGPQWGIAAVGDFNHDHTADILWRNVATGDTREWQMSNGALANNVVLPAATSDWHYVATGDFDHNGTDDLMLQNVNSGEVREWLLDSTGHLSGNVILGVLPADWTTAVTGATHTDYLGFI